MAPSSRRRFSLLSRHQDLSLQTIRGCDLSSENPPCWSLRLNISADAYQPLTILSFAAVFAGLGVTEGTNGNYINAAILVLGVFIGSILWWLILTGFVGLFHSKFSPDRLKWVNRISGTIITLFGLIALISLKT